jgi:D-alanyl-D-alanine carboxypeptidase
VRLEKRKSPARLLAVARKKRRRDRWLVGAMTLVSVLVLGFSFTGATMQVRLRSAIHPAAQPGPQAADTEQSGEDEPLNILRAESARVQAAPGETCDDLRVLVDRSHPLPPDYAPRDLVSLLDYRIPTLGGDKMLLRREAAGHLRRLVKDADAEGEELVVASAYRSYADQKVSHARLRSIYGPQASEMSATPGHSQHELGTAVDFANGAAGYEIWRYFGETSAYSWLQQHAREYAVSSSLTRAVRRTRPATSGNPGTIATLERRTPKASRRAA